MGASVVDVVAVEPLDGHCIHVEFKDGKRGVFDMTPYLDHGAFRQLRDPAFFRSVHVDCFTASWPGGLDIAPERLYDGCVPCTE